MASCQSCSKSGQRAVEAQKTQDSLNTILRQKQIKDSTDAAQIAACKRYYEESCFLTGQIDGKINYAFAQNSDFYVYLTLTSINKGGSVDVDDAIRIRDILKNEVSLFGAQAHFDFEKFQDGKDGKDGSRVFIGLFSVARPKTQGVPLNGLDEALRMISMIQNQTGSVVTKDTWHPTVSLSYNE